VQLQFSEATAVRQLDVVQKKLTRLEAQLLRTEQSMDEKDRTIYHNSLEARNKVHHLKHTIQVFVGVAVFRIRKPVPLCGRQINEMLLLKKWTTFVKLMIRYNMI